MSKNPKAFYVVWNPEGGPPTFRHGTIMGAEMEATRLARENPGRHFFVLGTIAEVVKADVTVTRFEQDSEIPF